jgi:hypothetical protein
MKTQRLMAVAVVLALAGCATSFSPERIRGEIAAQTGADPQGVFEFTLGPTTMALARTLFASASTEAAGGSQPLSRRVWSGAA